ncbi:hypothetical protein Q4Q35_00025 [Flavivirga aquimarina]|uniref:Thioredoxin-like fold domain-containing protein n=1 Tax=Flavivirga aquimarina TaxID=2027862 RepID=A0ABT8W517_9FLAO|nr:hypothetical protein [Flavivirga aquimarina]MDO5968182.1 hypothetical protein [Flavivirga aquimarina]
MIGIWQIKKVMMYLPKKYPMDGELEQQNDKIEAMHNWCVAEKITHTPTISINGYELPKEYNVDDLREILQ